MAIKGTLPVLPTPFRDGHVDAASLERMLKRTIPHVDGYTVLGSTGEAPSMTIEERKEAVETILKLTPADKSVVVGIAHTSVTDSVRLAQHAQKHGAKGVLLPAPFYFPNTPEGIFNFLRVVDDAIDIDLVLYDNPVTTKTTLVSGVVTEWARQLKHLSTVKLTDHDIAKVETWKSGGLNVLAGDDVILFRYLAAGVDGSMVLAPAIFPESFATVWGHMQSGDVAQAFAVFTSELLPFMHVFGVGDEIPTSKALLHEIGVFESAELRPPLQATTPGRIKLLMLAYRQCIMAADTRLSGDRKSRQPTGTHRR